MEKCAPPDYQNESSKGKELFLDTHGACFLCLKEISSTSDKDGGREICLRVICRYLKINPCSILLKSLKGDLLNAEEETFQNDNKCDFSVLLCAACSSLAESISKIVREMEIANILLSHHFQKFHNTLFSSQQQDSESLCLWNKLKEKMSTGPNPVEARLVEYLRHETREKSSTRVKKLIRNSVPKVILSKIKTKKKTSHIKLPQETPLCIDITSNDIEPSCSKSDNDNTIKTCENVTSEKPVQQNNLCTDMSELNIVSEESADFKIFTRHYKVLEPGNRYKCVYCNLDVNSGSEVIRNHLARIHPEMLFAHTKVPHVSNIKFKKSCTRMLKLERREAQQRFMGSASSKDCFGYFCGYDCNREFPMELENEYLVHLISDHCSVLERKLFTAQEKITANNSISLSNHNDNTQIQNFAGDRQIHQNTNLPNSEQVYDSHHEPSVNITEIQSESNQKEFICPTSTFQSCSSVMNTLPISIVFKDNGNGNQAKTKKKSAKNISDSSTPNDMTFVQDTIAKLHRKVHPGNNSTAVRYCCLVCNRYYSPSKIRHHLVNTHTEVIFAHRRLSHLSEEMFRLSCKQLLSKETNAATRIASGEPSKRKRTLFCSFCTFKYSDGNHLRFHMVTKHYSVLEEKLMQLQSKKKIKTTATSNVDKPTPRNEFLEQQISIGTLNDVPTMLYTDCGYSQESIGCTQQTIAMGNNDHSSQVLNEEHFSFSHPIPNSTFINNPQYDLMENNVRLVNMEGSWDHQTQHGNNIMQMDQISGTNFGAMMGSNEQLMNIASCVPQSAVINIPVHSEFDLKAEYIFPNISCS